MHLPTNRVMELSITMVEAVEAVTVPAQGNALPLMPVQVISTEVSTVMVEGVSEEAPGDGRMPPRRLLARSTEPEIPLKRFVIGGETLRLEVEASVGVGAGTTTAEVLSVGCMDFGEAKVPVIVDPLDGAVDRTTVEGEVPNDAGEDGGVTMRVAGCCVFVS